MLGKKLQIETIMEYILNTNEGFVFYTMFLFSVSNLKKIMHCI